MLFLLLPVTKASLAFSKKIKSMCMKTGYEKIRRAKQSSMVLWDKGAETKLIGTDSSCSKKQKILCLIQK